MPDLDFARIRHLNSCPISAAITLASGFVFPTKRLGDIQLISTLTAFNQVPELQNREVPGVPSPFIVGAMTSTGAKRLTEFANKFTALIPAFISLW